MECVSIQRFGYSTAPTSINDASYKRLKARCDGIIAKRDQERAEAAEVERVAQRLREIRADFDDMIAQRTESVEDGTEAAPAFTTFMRRDDWRTLVQDTMSADEIGVHWSSLVAGLESTIDAIRADSIADLAAILREGATVIDDASDRDLVERASSIFKCSVCAKDELAFPRVLDHDCGAGDDGKLPSLERPTGKMQLCRPRLGPMMETALEAAGFEPHMLASELGPLSLRTRFFVSPLWRARGGPGVHPLILHDQHRLIQLVRRSRSGRLTRQLITIIDQGVDQNVAAFIRASTHADDMDSIELTSCKACTDQRIDTPREIRLHLGQKCAACSLAPH